MPVILSSIVGGIVAMIFGAIWYGVFASAWQAGAGVTDAQVMAISGAMYLVPLLAWIIGAFGLNSLMGMVASKSWHTFIRLTFFVWLSGAMVAVALLTFFGLKGTALYWIDGLHMLIALMLVMAVGKLIRYRNAD